MRIPLVRHGPVLPRLAAVVAFLGGVSLSNVAAQETGTLFVTVRRPDSLPLAGAFVRSDRIGGIADDAGQARVELPARLVSVTVSHPGFEPRIFEITILPRVEQRYELYLARRADGPAAPARTARSARRVADEPVPLRVLGADELAIRTQAHPTDLSRIFAGIPGIRAQTELGPLDPNRFRAFGVPGRYTGVLIDGMPLLGATAGGFGAMQLSPLEFDRVEWLRGPAAGYYGAAAPAGVINLISRRPERDQARVGINQSSEKGGDILLWASRRHSPTLSGSFSADFHQQRLVDSDDDNWGEFPRAIRFSVRPRVFLDLPNGDAVTFTAGATTEDRTGGFLRANTGVDLYQEERRTRRFDGAVTARRLVGRTGSVHLSVSAVAQAVSHRFDDFRERDRRSTLFGEAWYRRGIGQGSAVIGLSYLRDALTQRDLEGFDYTHKVPSVFGSVTYPLSGRVVASLAGRCDDHNLHGLQCFPRADLLVRVDDRVETRLFGGLGYTSPTPLADAAEALGLHATVPVATRSERLAAAGVDVRWRRAELELGAVATYTRIAEPIKAVPFLPDPGRRLRLLNLAEPTRVFSLDLSADYRVASFDVGGYYGFRTGSEGIPGATGRRDLELTPKHQVGLTGGWRAPASTGTAITVDLLHVGQQSVWDNPFRTETSGYTLMNGLVSQRSGRARLYLSAENLLNVRLRQFEPVVLDAPTAGGRRTTMPWAPLRGRVLSLGALVDW